VGVSGRGVDFFISHAGRDTAWAEWLAWQLQQAGYRVELDVWDWAPGDDFMARIQRALERSDRHATPKDHAVAAPMPASESQL
jgi:hypothetical protein